MRAGYPLEKFKDGESDYVFNAGDYVEDYGSGYPDTATLLELVYNIMVRETGDKVWCDKILEILAERCGISDRLLPSQTVRCIICGKTIAREEYDDASHFIECLKRDSIE
jgi:hypothetical protein